MRIHTATLMSDFYKQAHAEQYNDKLTLLVDYLTPRTSRLKDMDYLISWGYQGFVKEFLIEYFNQSFFNRPIDEVLAEHQRVIRACMTKNHVDYQKIRDLHNLGYLPIEIRVIPEGTKVPIHVPMLEIRNTHPDFIWLVGFIESIMSCELWYPMCVANQAYTYRQIANKWYNMTVENGSELAKHAISEFGFRGAKGREAGIMASSAFLTSFDKTATIPALMYLEDYYNCNLEEGNVGGGMLSTEHSVMCSNTSIDGDEDKFYHKLFTQLYPSESLSVVCDSYDYWRIVTDVICKKYKQDIMNRDGTVFVRGDSGDPLEIMAGKNKYKLCWNMEDFNNHAMKLSGYSNEVVEYYKVFSNSDVPFKYFEVVKSPYNGGNTITEIEANPEDIGTIECLFNAFGGRINDCGYIELNKHIRGIYGDSITPVLADEIYSRLESQGFAANNIALGAGSFSMQCTREGDHLKPFTRDTYGIAIKATYGEMSDGTPIEIFKNPKTDNGVKKSQRGMCYVHYNDKGEIVYEDGYNSSNIPSNVDGNLFITIFKDGKTMNEVSIHDVRNRLHNNEF